MRLLFIFTLFFFTQSPVFSQDFYLNNESEVVYLNYLISPGWIDLNINESYEFLNNSGFTEIKSTSNNNQEIVTGKINNKQYVYTRNLVFENKLIKEYSDEIIFLKTCILCLANELQIKLQNNPSMQSIIEQKTQEAIKLDTKDKDLFLKYHTESLKRDGIQSQLLGNMTDFGFNFSNSLNTKDFIIVRNCSLKLYKKRIYNYYSEKKVTIVEKNYFVDNYNLKEVNQYDLVHDKK